MLSTKHLVSNRGHNAHAQHAALFNWIPKVLETIFKLNNIVDGYSVPVDCMVCCVLWLGCVSSNSVVSAIDFNLAKTNFCSRKRLFLYATRAL